MARDRHDVGLNGAILFCWIILAIGSYYRVRSGWSGLAAH